MAKSLIPLDLISSDLSADIGDSTMKHKFKFTRHLLSGYRKLHMFIGQSIDIKTAVLSFDNTIQLPCDFVYETKVGVLYKGRLAVLSLDNSVKHQKLNDTQTTDYLNSVWDGTYSGDGFYFYNAFRDDDSLGELYGMGRGLFNSGTYSIDKTQGVIYIGSHIPVDAEIVIEYKSDGVSNGLKLVPIEMKECLEFYAKWKWYADRNITQSQINKNNYQEEYFQLKRLYNFKNALYMGSKINQYFSPSNY